MKKHLVTTVDKYGYARLHEDIHYYSVPHIFIGKKVQLSYTAADVEIYYEYDLIARYTRDRHTYRYITRAEHLCPKHRAVLEWTPEKFISQAELYTKMWSIISARYSNASDMQIRLTSAVRVL